MPDAMVWVLAVVVESNADGLVVAHPNRPRIHLRNR